MRNEATVREANEAFYRAFEAMDVEQMAQSWVQSDATVFHHPDGYAPGTADTGVWRTILPTRLHAQCIRCSNPNRGRDGLTVGENIFTVIDGMTIHS